MLMTLPSCFPNQSQTYVNLQSIAGELVYILHIANNDTLCVAITIRTLQAATTGQKLSTEIKCEIMLTC